MLHAHLSDEETLVLLSDVTGPFFQNGPATYDYVMSNVIIGITQSELNNLNAEWTLLSIVKDIGCSVNTIMDILKRLRVINALRPAANRFSDEQLAEKVLIMIKDGSATFGPAAHEELDAVEGVPGQPGVRKFQLPQPMIGGVPQPRPRNLIGICTHFHNLWSDAVKAKRIQPFEPTNSGVVAPRQQVEHTTS